MITGLRALCFGVLAACLTACSLSPAASEEVGESGGESKISGVELSGVKSSLDLTAPEGFHFNATRAVQLRISIPAPIGKRAYLSVYTHFDAAKKMADYKTRVTMLPVPQSMQLDVQLNLPTYLEEIWLEVWYADQPEHPIKTSVTLGTELILLEL